MKSITLDVPLAERMAALKAVAVEGAHNQVVGDWASDIVERTLFTDWLRLLHMQVVKLPVLIDPPGVDQYQTCIETLARGGDCANKSTLLAAAILSAFRRGRVPVVVALCWEHSGGPEDHVRLAVQTEFSQGWVIVDALHQTLNKRLPPWVPLWTEFVII